MYRVMIVDDDMAVCYVYRNMKSWEKHGFEIVLEANNGRQALELLEKNSVDIIFTDIRMPVMDGIDLLKTIRQRGLDIFVVLISSYKEFEYAREGLKFGAVDYVMKPLTENALDESLEFLKKYMNEKSDNKEVRNMVVDVMKKYGANPDDSLIKNVCAYISDNIGTDITMDDISSNLGLSKDYFGKLIKQKTGQNFKTIYTDIKMEYAKMLIIGGQHKMYEISDMLGYSSADYFARVFKDTFGMSPAEFRKNT
ncbi:MAG: response regulator [Acutalibacteraceae bacterium]